jgi:hypothetical protein
MYVVISFAVSENVSTVPIVMTGSFSALEGRNYAQEGIFDTR